MIDTQKFNFTPVKYSDSITIHKDGMQIDVDVSYSSIIDIVTQLNDEEKWNLVQLMKGVG